MDNFENTADNHERIKELITTGSEVTGGISGAVIGMLIAGPSGSIIGGAIGPIVSKLFTKVGIEIKNRILGRREEIKIGATYTYALDKINQRLTNGDNLRSDSFFSQSLGKRSASEEILEGALMKAQREHEELKLRHYGYLIANISFDNSVNRELANFLIKIMERLSYRQLCMLEIFNDSKPHNLYKSYVPPPFKFHSTEELMKNPQLWLNQYTGQDVSPHLFNYRAPVSQWTSDLAAELEELSFLKLINLDSANSKSFEKVTLTMNGKKFRSLMELNQLNLKDIASVANELRYEQKGPNDL